MSNAVNVLPLGLRSYAEIYSLGFYCCQLSTVFRTVSLRLDARSNTSSAQLFSVNNIIELPKQRLENTGTSLTKKQKQIRHSLIAKQPENKAQAAAMQATRKQIEREEFE